MSNIPANDQYLEYDFVRFTAVNIHGMPFGKAVTKKHLPKYWKDGIRIPAVLLGFGPRSQPVAIEEGDAQGYANKIYKAIPDTIHPVPWAACPGSKVGEVIAEVYNTDGELHGCCSRGIARKQIDRLQKEFGYQLMSSFEHEVILLHEDSMKPVNDGDFTNYNFTDCEGFLYSLITLLEEAGVGIECLHCEAAEGQFELAGTTAMGLKTLDNAFIFKEAVKEVSKKAGYMATFMTRPMEGCANAAHYNLSLWDAAGKNVFYDPNRGMSKSFDHWLAGLIKHAPAIQAICSPTVNCYRRLGLPWAPSKVNWGIDNRLTAFRVKTYDLKQTFMENRLPTGASNPYLVAAVTLAAGMDGLKNSLPLPSAMSDTAESIPATLEEALDALEKDEVIKDALGPLFVDWFLLEKKSIELEILKDHDISNLIPSQLQKERDMYLKYI